MSGTMSAGPPAQYYIADGVHRAVAARENHLAAIPARLVIQGQQDQLILVRLDQLHSPKPTIHLAVTARRNYPALENAMGSAKGRATIPAIEIQPLGVPGQTASVPLTQVQIVP